MKKYSPQTIEKKWQKYWKSKKLYEAADVVVGKENFYKLVEFPYPSGNLHMGHWYSFAVPDIYARYQRMSGYNVLYPMGFDAFGLPAENAAIKNNVQPADWTKQNIKHMTKQMESMGASFDWSRTVSTIDPDYYRWTQWIFLQFYKAGLAYRAKTLVNWCPKDKTVLANEQVVDGKCDRCGSDVEQREREQWMYRITKYADALVDGLEKVDWPEATKTAQRNWIGRSEGVEIDFSLLPANVKRFVVLHGKGGSPEKNCFPTLKKLLEQKGFEVIIPTLPNTTNPDDEEQLAFVKNNITLDEDTIILGHSFGAVVALRLLESGTKVHGIITAAMPVSGEFLDHKSRPSVERAVKKGFDFETIKKNAKSFLILSDLGDDVVPPTDGRTLAENLGVRLIEAYAQASHFSAAEEPLIEEACLPSIKIFTTRPDTIFSVTFLAIPAKEQGEKFTGEYAVNPANGEKIPVWTADYVLATYGSGAIMGVPAYDERDEAFAKKHDLPIIKAPFTDKIFGTKKTNYRLHDWILSRQRYWGTPIPMIKCEDCGYQPVPEEKLPVKLPKLENYLPADDGSSPLARTEKWVHTKCPNCGKAATRETDTMDTFVDSSWYFLRYTDPQNKDELATKEKINAWNPVDMYTGGSEHNTMHLLYSRFFIKAMHELGIVNFDEPFLMRRNHGIVLGPDGQKMSKSKGNVVDPDKEVTEYGADTVRMYLAFLGPYDTFNGPFDPKGIIGIYRFLSKVWKLAHEKQAETNERRLHQAIKKVGEDITSLHFNTAISELMKLLNERGVVDDTFLKLLAPFAPHLTEEIWMSILGHDTSVHLESWPTYDPNLLVETSADFVIQINGKMRGVIRLPSGSDEVSVRTAAEKDEKIAKYITGSVKKVIFIPGKLCNLII